MKVRNNVKNILIQEFQHSLGSKLTEVMKMQMLPIQFVRSVNLIQIQSIEVAEASCSEIEFSAFSEGLSETESSSESRPEQSQQKSVRSVQLF
jgi:hypothetical protein